MEAEFSVHTTKNMVDIREDHVQKTFKNVRTGRVRFRREVEALRRLAGVNGIPLVLDRTDAGLTLLITRLPGIDLVSCPSPPDTCFVELRSIVAEMLRRGVARHSIPPRDVIVGPDGSAGLVDFERITLRGWRFSPVWGFACVITRFHLLRLIGDRAPHLLTPRERLRLRLQRGFRNLFRVFINLRRRLRAKKKA